MERNYSMDQKFFDEAAYLELFAAIKGSSDPDAGLDLDALNSAMESFCDYVDGVDNTELAIKMAYARLDGEELRESVQRYDGLRRQRHEAAIGNVRLINRLAKLYGVKPLFVGDEKDRLQVADFTLEVVTFLFKNRKK